MALNAVRVDCTSDRVSASAHDYRPGTGLRLQCTSLAIQPERPRQLIERDGGFGGFSNV